MRTVLSTTAIAALVVAASIQTSEARSSHHSTRYVSHSYARSASHARSGTRRYARLGHSHVAATAHGGAGCGSLTAVHARSGATACVASSAASNFQEFVSALESTGYRIDFMGGWRAHGSCGRCNMHPRGLAIDINQTGRSRVTRGFPSGVTALAARYGLLHGAVWSHPDVGHFELASASPTLHGVYASADRAGRRSSRHAMATMTGVSMETPAGDRQGGGF